MNVRDDYERWYTEATPNNRMLLALRSGIQSEIGWALDRLCRLSENEQFILSNIPDLTAALFEWPLWLVTEGHKEQPKEDNLFAQSTSWDRKLQNAAESIFSLRNCSFVEANAQVIMSYRPATRFMLLALHSLSFQKDVYNEFLLHTVEMLQNIAPVFSLPSPPLPHEKNPIPPLVKIVSNCSNRSLIIASFNTLATLLTNPRNASHLSSKSPAVQAAIKYLPLMGDKPLLEASLNHLYAHLSQPVLAKAFLFHPQLSGTLKSLISVLLDEQHTETVTVDVSRPVYTASSSKVVTRLYDMPMDELERLAPVPEPQRCYEWMRAMFVSKPDGELTQVKFWELYRDMFSQFADRYHMLVATDVIKNVSVVFESGIAMVLPGSSSFVVRGVDRRRVADSHEAHKCLWNRAQCQSAAFENASALYEHMLEHHLAVEGDSSCQWSSCQRSLPSKATLRAHALTHLASPPEDQKPISQSDTVTLSSPTEPYPVADSTSRPPPPPPSASFSYPQPRADPPATSLTALLCIRILFRTSFASVETVTKADGDHFGFPGVVEEDMESDLLSGPVVESEEEGEKRGRRAFVSARRLLEGVQILDDTLMGWITEMIDASMYGIN